MFALYSSCVLVFVPCYDTYGGREVHSNFAFPVSRFAFSVSRLPHFAAFHTFPFSILCFAFLVSRFVRGYLFGCVCHLSFHVSRFSFLVSRFSFHISRFTFSHSRRPSPDTRRFHRARTSSQTDGRIRLARRKERQPSSRFKKRVGPGATTSKDRSRRRQRQTVGEGRACRNSITCQERISYFVMRDKAWFRG